MQALPQLIGLQSLESRIDYLPLMVVRETSLFRCDVYDGLRLRTDVARGKSVLFFSSSQVVEYFTKHDMVLLVASGTSLKTANIFEVMHTSVITLNVSDFSEIASVLLLLRQQQFDLVAVVDNQGNIVSNITLVSVQSLL
ncbi:MAG: hypothetical protein V7K90_16910 [Nostoc sp.]|uniref:hypothetical protein n=1 Tax=Nostoc sp. TaxID=1180 RepID=UPI002FF931AD